MNRISQHVSFFEAFKYWLKLGFISFGGPAGQIALMHHDLVEKKRWISDQRFLHALNYCMLLPGPEAQQLAIYLGWLMHRTWGGIVAGVLFVLPSFILLVILTWVYLVYGHVPIVAGVLYGFKPAVAAIVLFAAYRIGKRSLKNKALFGIALAAFVAIFIFKLPFPFIILLAAAIGTMGGRWAPNTFAATGGHNQAKKSDGSAMIDDDTPTPPHAVYSHKKMLWTAVAGVAIWLSVLIPLVFFNGWQAQLTQISWFFTKAALMTFGGAYAVLPYVFQAAVEHYHWLTAPQMMDGLALGETTPGPLIMVVTYIGFVAGWVNTSALHSFNYALTTASVATFFTFLPSFVFIFVGAPFIECTHGKIQFTAPITAISAAVVGVIMNLAVFFGFNALWPHGFDHAIDRFTLIIGFAAALALFRYQLGVIPVLLLCGLAGAAYVVFIT